MVETGSLLPLIYNGALLLGLAFLYDLLAIPARDGTSTRPQQLLLGAGVGVLGVILMVTPWHFNEGVVFDTRSVLLSISGLFFGVVPTVVAMLMTSALRIYQGGAGAFTGVSVIVATGCIGIGWRLWHKPALAALSWRELYRFGWIVHGVMLFLFMVTLPWATAQQVLAAITVPVLLVYPLATMLLGQLLVNRQRRELAAEALLASELRHRSYVDSAPYGVMIVDATGAYLEANPAACQISGYSLEELLKLRITDLLTADAQPAGLQHFQQVATTGQAYGEFAVRRKDGSGGWMSVAAVQLSPTRILGFVSDITERKTTQEALRQAEQDYRDLYEHAPDLFLSVDTATGRIIQCNETLAKALGYRKDELLGQRVVDFYAPGQESIYQQISHAFVTTGQIQNAELQIQRKDGSLLHVILNATAVRDEQGKILHSRASWRDVSERKAAEELAAIAQTALRQNEERFRHVASSISDIAYSCVAPAGGSYHLEWMTGAAERITGYTVDEIIAMGCWVHLVTAEDEPLFAEHITGLAVGATSTCEVRLNTRHGEIVWVAVTAECVADGTGRRLYGAVIDITDRKRAEAALRQSEEKAVALINATSEAAFLMTPDGVVLALNMELARRLSVSAGDIIGHTIYDFLLPEAALRRNNIVQEVMRTRQPLRFRDERSQTTIDNSIYPILDANGEVTQLAVYARDVTAQKVAEERYQTLFREMLDGFALHEIICDEQGRPIDYRFVDVNPAFERLTGLRAKAVVGRTILEVLPTTEPYWIDTYGRVALTGEPVFVENFSQAIGRHFEVTAFSPAANQFATIFVDVTERRRVETALRRRDALLEALSFAADRFLQVANWEKVMPEVLEQLGTAAAVSRVYLFQNDTKPSGRILSSQRFEWCAPGVSPQIENQVLQNVPFSQIGFERWEMLLSQGALISGNVRDFPEDEQAPLREQEILSLVVVPIHAERQWWGFVGFDRCDSEYDWPEAELRVLQATGHTIGAAIENQTSRTRLHRQAGQMTQIMRSVTEGMLLIDGEGTVILANPRATIYLEQLTGEPDCRRVTHLGEQPLTMLLTSPPLGQGHAVHSGRRTYNVLAHPVENTGDPTGWVLVIRDITDELAVQEQLHRQERLAAIGQLAAGIAHDFNNLMSVIILYAQLTARTPGMGERERERMAVIEQQGMRATQMIRQILDFSRRAALERQPLDLLPLVKEQIKLLERTLPENVVVHFAYTPGEYVVRADPTRVEQVIMNLAVNARDAMPEGGRLMVRLEHTKVATAKQAPIAGMKAGVWICLIVTDTGSGITPEAMDHMFEPFFTTKAPGMGTGLGLAQVHGIVAQHDGFVAVESQVHKGSTFSIYLPALDTEHPGVTPMAAVGQVAGGQGETILVVEDDAALQRTLSELLTMWNYRAVAVDNGSQALALLEKGNSGIDLILSDVVMPEMGGIALFHALRQRQVNLPVILLTGHPMVDELENLHKQGLHAWLLKPPSAEQLAQTIAEALAKSRTA